MLFEGLRRFLRQYSCQRAAAGKRFPGATVAAIRSAWHFILLRSTLLMSLRKKLYLSYLVMILLVVFTGFMAIRAFWRTNKVVESTRSQVSNVSEILVPANQLITQVYTDVNQASLYFHAYSFNRVQADYDEGMKNVGQIRERTGKIEEIMKQPRAIMLAQSQKDLQQVMPGLEAMDSQARSLRALMQRTDDLQRQINEEMENISIILDDLYNGVMDDIAAEFEGVLAIGSREGVVRNNPDGGIVSPDHIHNRFDVHYFERGVGGRFHVHDRGFRPQGFLDRFHISGFQKR
jgi:Predicted periplasmic ligand-binding sensor domain